MTDLEKFKQLFDDIGIRYTEEKSFFSKEDIELSISEDAMLSEDSMLRGYNTGLDIRFSEDGKFKMFLPSGE